MKVVHFDTQAASNKTTVHNIHLELSDDENNPEFVNDLIPEFVEPLRLKLIGSEFKWTKSEGKNIVSMFVESANEHMVFDREVTEGFVSILKGDF